MEPYDASPTHTSSRSTGSGSAAHYAFWLSCSTLYAAFTQVLVDISLSGFNDMAVSGGHRCLLLLLNQ